MQGPLILNTSQENSGDIRNGIRAWIFPTLTVITSFALQMGRINSLGRIRGEATWDDVGYVIAGYDRSQILMQHGLPDWLTSFHINPLHGPFIEILANLSGLIFGANEKPIYFFHGAIIFLGIIYSFIRLTPNSRNKATYLACIFFVSPVGFFLVNEFRPESLYSVVLAAIGIEVMKLFQTDSTSRSFASRPVWLAITLLYLKPTFLLCTVLIMVLTTILWLWRVQVVDSKYFKIFQFLKFFIATLPFDFLIFPSTYSYIKSIRLGGQSKWWVSDSWGSFQTNIKSAIRLFSWSFPIALTFVGIALFWIFAQKDVQKFKKFFAFMIFISVVALCVYSTSIVSPYFGSIIIVPLILGFSAFVGHVLDRKAFVKLFPIIQTKTSLGLWTGLALLLILFVNTAVVEKSPLFEKEDFPPYLFNTRILKAILDDCASSEQCLSSGLEKGQLPQVAVAPVTPIVDAIYIDWLARKQGLSGNINNANFSSGEDWFKNAKTSANYLIFSNSRHLIPMIYSPNKLQSKWLADVRGGEVWREIKVPMVNPDFLVFAKN